MLLGYRTFGNDPRAGELSCEYSPNIITHFQDLFDCHNSSQLFSATWSREKSSSMMSLFMFNAAQWRAVQLFTFQTLYGSTYCNITWTFPVSDCYLTFLKVLQDSTVYSMQMMFLHQTDYSISLSSKQIHHINQVQFPYDISLICDYLCAPRTAWQRLLVFVLYNHVMCTCKCFPWDRVLFESLPLWSTLTIFL